MKKLIEVVKNVLVKLRNFFKKENVKQFVSDYLNILKFYAILTFCIGFIATIIIGIQASLPLIVIVKALILLPFFMVATVVLNPIILAQTLVEVLAVTIVFGLIERTIIARHNKKIDNRFVYEDGQIIDSLSGEVIHA